jgi:hypothetical protein
MSDLFLSRTWTKIDARPCDHRAIPAAGMSFCGDMLA